MSNVAQSEMDVDVFLLWAEGRDGRWELRDGKPVLMSPERAAHALTKICGAKGARGGNQARRAPVPHVSRRDDGEDHGAQRLRAGRAGRLSAASASTRSKFPIRSLLWKSFRRARRRTTTESSSTAISRVPSVDHYLILDADRRVMIHHKRGPGRGDRNPGPARGPGPPRPARFGLRGRGVLR